MSSAARSPTNAELCAQADALPHPLVGEVIDGTLYAMARPSPAHANVEVEIVGDLKIGRHGGGPPPDGWYIQAEVEVRFSNDEKVVPDLTGWRTERVAGHRNDNPIRIVPDWVCEILSDGTRRKDLGPKRDMYARHGVKHLWLVEPENHVLEAFELGTDGRWVLLGTWIEDAVAEVPPFQGTTLVLSRWWLREP